MRLTGVRYTTAARANARRPPRPQAAAVALTLGGKPLSPRTMAAVLALGRQHPRDTVWPQSGATQAAGRCTEGACESVERILKAANPGMSMDLADSAMMTCYHCGDGVCCCQTAPVEFAGGCLICPRCSQDWSSLNGSSLSAV
jgi:hypothetical protein